MLEGVDFNVLYAPVAGIISFCIIISIDSAEGLIIFVLGISNKVQSNIFYVFFRIEFILVYHIFT